MHIATSSNPTSNFHAIYPQRMALSLVMMTVLGLLVGCGGGSVDKLGRLSVSGKVTLDGAPLAKGTIRFEPFGTKEKTIATGEFIKAGRYSIPASAGLPPGKYTASISSHAEEGTAAASTDPNEAMNAAAAAKPATETIPAKYNTQTELVVEVKKGATNAFDFDLKSEKK